MAGHDNLKTTMRYVQPRAEAVGKLFERFADLGPGPQDGQVSACGTNRPQKQPHSWTAADQQIAKSLDLSSLQRAEVVELADTPSIIIALLFVYKWLILNLISFNSISSTKHSSDRQ